MKCLYLLIFCPLNTFYKGRLRVVYLIKLNVFKNYFDFLKISVDK